MNMSSKCLTVAVEPWLPFITTEGEGDSLRVDGIMPEVIDIIMKKLGTCYTFVRSEDRVFGERMANGSWSGLMGIVSREVANLSGLGVMITPERLRAVDVSEYLYVDEISAGYMNPVIQSDIKGFLKPFAFHSWILILLTIVAVLTVSCGVRVAYTRLSHGSKKKRSSQGQARRLKTESPMYEAVLWTVGSILAQPVDNITRGNSVRVITGLWLLTSLIIGIVYRSNLKAMLILPKVNLPFDNLHQLAESGLPVWVSPSSTLNQAIQSAPRNSTLGRLVPQVYHSKPFLSIQRLLSGDHVLMVPRSALLPILQDTFSKTGKCKNYIMSETFMKTTLRLIFPKGSALKAKVDPIIWRLRESGMLDHIYMKSISNGTECLRHEGATPNKSRRTLEIGDFYGIFIVYATGILLALLTFSVEMVLGLARSDE